MKNTYTLLLLFFLISISSALPQKGGLYKPVLTNKGEYFRVLFVFAQFVSDTTEMPAWKLKQLPDWSDKIIDPELSDVYRQFTISDYFKKMSFDQYDIIGDVYPELVMVPVDTNHRIANLYVLEELNKNIKDFRRYDNWKYENKNLVFSEGNGDGYIDLIHIIYRRGEIKWFPVWGGIAELGISKNFVTHDSLKFNGGSANSIGSGITTNNLRLSLWDNFTFTQHFAHEFGHYVFGGGHTAIGGIMPGAPFEYSGITYAMDAWEKKWLGYISLIEGKDGDEIILRDFVTTGDAVFIEASPDTIFIIENHQRKSPYDQIIRGGSNGGAWNPETKYGRGIYIYFIQRSSSFPPQKFLLSADGSWDWEYAGDMKMSEGWPESLPLIDKAISWRFLPDNLMNSKGKGDRNSQLTVKGLNGRHTRWHKKDELTGEWILSRPVMGDEDDAFNPGYNEILSPWSNPSTTFYKNGKEVLSNISVQLLSENENGDIKIKIIKSYEGSVLLPPSKPQKPEADTSSYHPHLSWEKNTEPDLQSYNIYRSMDNMNWIKIASTNEPSYTDVSIQSDTDIDTFYYYRIAAVDDQKQISVYSNPCRWTK